MKKSVNKKWFSIGRTIIFTVLALYTISVLAMYIWGILSSLKGKIEFQENIFGLPKGAPWNWRWENYALVFERMRVNTPNNGTARFMDMLRNSLIFTIVGGLICNFTTWLVAYLVTRFARYKASGIIYTMNIIFMTMPVLGNTPSALAIYSTLGWFNNYLFIIFNNIAFTGMYFLIYTAFIKGLGKEFYESAYVDGAGNFTVMMKIAFPLTSSMFFVALLLLCIDRWNDYMTMAIWLPDFPSIAYGIWYSTTSSDSGLAFPSLRIASCVLLMLPLLILFIFFQKPIMGNLRLGAIKG